MSTCSPIVLRIASTGAMSSRRWGASTASLMVTSRGGIQSLRWMTVDVAPTPAATISNQPAPSKPPLGRTSHVSRIRPREGDWTCGACQSVNFASNTSCFRCQLARPIHHTSDGQSTTTMNAGIPTQQRQLSPDEAAAANPNSWKCIKCQTNNFPSRMSCFTCKASKHVSVPSSTPTGGTAAAGQSVAGVGGKPLNAWHTEHSWKCPVCEKMNFPRRTSCYHCKEVRPPTTTSIGNQCKDGETTTTFCPPKTTAWICEMCQSYNPFEGIDCEKCGAEAGDTSTAAVIPGSSSAAAAGPRASPVQAALDFFGWKASSEVGASARSHVASTARPAVPLTTLSTVPAGRESNPMPGDWICPSPCRSINKPEMSTCNRCAAPKPPTAAFFLEAIGHWSVSRQGSTAVGDSEQPSNNSEQQQLTLTGRRMPLSVGDWWCAGCYKENFARRTDCRHCGIAKSADCRVVTSAELRLPGEWTCASCATNNFSTRGTCRKCRQPQHPMGEEETVVPPAAVGAVGT